MTYRLASLLCCIGVASAAMPPAQKQIAQDFMTQGQALGDEMQRRLTEVKAEQPIALINGARTPTREELTEAIRINGVVGKVYGDYELRFQQLITNTCNRMAAVNAKDGQDCRASNASFARRFVLQREYLAELTRLFNFLITRAGKYKNGSDGFSFEADRDVDTFNASAGKIEALMNEINAIRASGQAANEALRKRL